MLCSWLPGSDGRLVAAVAWIAAWSLYLLSGGLVGWGAKTASTPGKSDSEVILALQALALGVGGIVTMEFGLQSCVPCGHVSLPC